MLISLSFLFVGLFVFVSTLTFSVLTTVPLARAASAAVEDNGIIIIISLFFL